MVNNGILHAENSNWKLPVVGDTLSTVSLSNTSARTFARNIGLLFDIIFRHHEDGGLRRNAFYECVVTLYQDIMESLRKRSNMCASDIITLQK